MAELFAATLTSSEPLTSRTDSRLVQAALERMAQVGTLGDRAALKADAAAWCTAQETALRALPAKAAAKELPARSKLLALPAAMVTDLLHRAHPKEAPAVEALRVRLEVTSLRPDAPLPDPRDPWHTLNTFVARPLADATTKNEWHARYPKLLQPKLKLRAADVWGFALSKPKSAGAGRQTATLEVITEAALLSHLPKSWSSAAFEG
jgi:hypothetical protein